MYLSFARSSRKYLQLFLGMLSGPQCYDFLFQRPNLFGMNAICQGIFLFGTSAFKRGSFHSRMRGPSRVRLEMTVNRRRVR